MQKSNIFKTAQKGILRKPLLWLFPLSALLGLGKANAQTNDPIPINYAKLIEKKTDGTSYPKPAEFMEWLKESHPTDSDAVLPNLQIDSIPVASNEEIEKNIRCLYDKVKNTVIIRIPVLSKDFSNHRQREEITQYIGYLRIKSFQI